MVAWRPREDSRVLGVRGEGTAWESSESSVGVLMKEDVLAYMRCEIVHVNGGFVLIICIHNERN